MTALSRTLTTSTSIIVCGSPPKRYRLLKDRPHINLALYDGVPCRSCRSLAVAAGPCPLRVDIRLRLSALGPLCFYAFLIRSPSASACPRSLCRIPRRSQAHACQRPINGQGAVRPNLEPGLLGERRERKQIRPSVLKVVGHFGKLVRQRVGDPIVLRSTRFNIDRTPNATGHGPTATTTSGSRPAIRFVMYTLPRA